MTPLPPRDRDCRPVRRRSWLEVRWRQFRNAPRPIVRAVAANLVIATLLGVLYLGYDVALDRGAVLPGGDLRLVFLALYVVLVAAVGSLVTYLVVPLPSGADTRRLRSPWSAFLGFLAALPIAYLVLAVLVDVVRPLLG